MKKLYYLLLEEDDNKENSENQKENTQSDENTNNENSNQEGGGDDFSFLDDDTLNKVSENIKDIPDTDPLSEEENEETKEDTESESDDGASIYKNEDEEKVKKLFTDSGDPKVDYSLNSDSNKRLAKFKFKYAGIDINSLMSDQEKKTGVRVDQLLTRLLPDQYEMYIQKSKELRKEFPLIAERERKIIIYNCNIPYFYRTKKGEMKQITNKRDLANAIDKVDKFMIKAFGENWVDDKYAIEFLQNIQIDFSAQKKIKSNLIPASFFTKKDFVVFNKFYIEMPDTIKKFINKNIENKQFENSSLFKIFVNDFKESKNSSKLSLYSLITSENKESSGEEESGEESNKEETGGELGGESTGGDLTGGIGGETGGEMGGEASGEEGVENIG